MAKSKVKRYADEGYVYEDDTPEEVANRSAEAQSIADEAKGDTMLKAMRDAAAKPKSVVKRKAATSTSTSASTSTPKTELKYQSLQDRETEAQAKRKEAGKSFYGDSFLSRGLNAIKERIAGNASGERSKDRVLKDASIKKSEQKFMGSGMKSGGKTSSASKRADGIATKGKTRGRYM